MERELKIYPFQGFIFALRTIKSLSMDYCTFVFCNRIGIAFWSNCCCGCRWRRSCAGDRRWNFLSCWNSGSSCVLCEDFRREILNGNAPFVVKCFGCDVLHGNASIRWLQKEKLSWWEPIQWEKPFVSL